MTTELLKARKQLDKDFALGAVDWLSYSMRKAAVIELIDDERRPVADKSLSLWLASGTPHLKGWLRLQGADVILGAEGPCASPDLTDLFHRGFLAPLETVVSVHAGPFRVYLEGEAINAIEWNTFYPSGICSIEPERDSTCADAVAFAWGIRTRTIPDFQWVVKVRSAERLINDCRNDLVNYNESRQPIADAAEFIWHRGAGQYRANLKYFAKDEIAILAKQEEARLDRARIPVADGAWFLLEHGNGDWLNILKDRTADHIVECARVRMGVLHDDRLPVADAAQQMWLSGDVTSSQWLKVMGVDGIKYSADVFSTARQASADKAQTLHTDFGLGLNSLVYASAQGDI